VGRLPDDAAVELCGAGLGRLDGTGLMSDKRGCCIMPGQYPEKRAVKKGLLL
jgi:hypothetical protein